MCSPAKIVHVAWLSQIGGGELFLLDLLESIDGERFDQEIYCVGPGGELLEKARDLGVCVRCFPRKTKLGIPTIWRLAGALRSAGPDVVQTHGEAGVFWGIPAARLAGCRAICALVYQNYRESADKMAAMRLLLPRAAVVVAGSKDVGRFLTREIGIEPSRVTVIHCGIDPRPFSGAAGGPARRASRPGAGPVVLTVGRLVERKGHAVLLHAFERVLDAHADAELWIAGDGPLRESLVQLARELRIDASVRFLGTVHPTTGLMASADLFVFPSLAEPQGLAILEAFAAGVPVVASRTGGIVEMLDDGKDGVLIEPGDSNVLGTAIVELLGDPVEREKLSRSARRRLQAFDIRRLARRYEAVYEALMQGDGAPPGVAQAGAAAE